MISYPNETDLGLDVFKTHLHIDEYNRDLVHSHSGSVFTRSTNSILVEESISSQLQSSSSCEQLHDNTRNSQQSSLSLRKGVNVHRNNLQSPIFHRLITTKQKNIFNLYQRGHIFSKICSCKLQLSRNTSQQSSILKIQHYEFSIQEIIQTKKSLLSYNIMATENSFTHVYTPFIFPNELMQSQPLSVTVTIRILETEDRNGVQNISVGRGMEARWGYEKYELQQSGNSQMRK